MKKLERKVLTDTPRDIEEFWNNLKRYSNNDRFRKKLFIEKYGKIFSEDMDEVCCEKIISEEYHTPLRYAKEFSDKTEKWNLKTKLLHLSDMVFYNEGEGQVTYDTIDKKSGDLEPIEGMKKSLKEPVYRRNNSLNIDSMNFDWLKFRVLTERFLLLETENNTYAIWCNMKNNNTHLFPEELKRIDNKYNMARTGYIKFQRLPKETTQEFRNLKEKSYNLACMTVLNKLGSEDISIWVDHDKTKNELDYLFRNIIIKQKK